MKSVYFVELTIVGLRFELNAQQFRLPLYRFPLLLQIQFAAVAVADSAAIIVYFCSCFCFCCCGGALSTSVQKVLIFIEP